MKSKEKTMVTSGNWNKKESTKTGDKMSKIEMEKARSNETRRKHETYLRSNKILMDAH